MSNPPSATPSPMDSIIEDIDEYVNEAAVVPFYVHHVFFCLNQRSTGERLCCANSGAQAAQEHAKRRIKALGLAGDGNVRINKSGCLERCEEGPALVIYPEGVWYTYFDTEDIDEIIDVHIVGGEIVERLKI